MGTGRPRRGDSFRLVRVSEATKLAQVRSTSQQSGFVPGQSDIIVRQGTPSCCGAERLRQIITRITSCSVTKNGARDRSVLRKTLVVPGSVADRDGIRFAINDQHPIIVSLTERLARGCRTCCARLFDLLQPLLLVEMIYSDYSQPTRARSISDRWMKARPWSAWRSLRQCCTATGQRDVVKAFLSGSVPHIFSLMHRMELCRKFINFSPLHEALQPSRKNEHCQRAHISAFAKWRKRRTRDQVEEKARQIAAIFGHAWGPPQHCHRSHGIGW